MLGNAIGSQLPEYQVTVHLPPEADAHTSSPSTQGLSVNPAVESVAQKQLSQGTSSSSSHASAEKQKSTKSFLNSQWLVVPPIIFDFLCHEEEVALSLTSRIGNRMFRKFIETRPTASYYNLTDNRLREIVKNSPNLKHLTLEIPSGLGDDLQLLTTLKNLQTLVLNGNNYRGEFAFLTHLKLLHLSLSDITTSNIDFLADHSTLRSLYLSSINIITKDTREELHDRHLTHLAALTELEDLSLATAEITNITFLSTLTNLHSLDLNGNLMTDDGLMSLSAFKKLEILYLRRANHISGSGLTHLTVLSQLHTLGLPGSKITGTDLSHLTVLSGLHTLNVSYSKITAPGLISLAALTSLTKLYMQSVIENERDFASLKPLTKLKLLDLQQTYCITGVALQNLASFRELEELNLGSCPKIVDRDLRCFTPLPALVKLDLRSTKVTIRGLDDLKAKSLLKGVQILIVDQSWKPIVWQW